MRLSGAALDQLLAERMQDDARAGHFARFRCAGVELEVECDDPELLAETRATLGGDESSVPRTALKARVRSEGPAAYGHVELLAPPGDVTTDDLALGLQSAGFPFEQLAGDVGTGWMLLAFSGESAPVLALRGEHCLFRRIPAWRTVVTLLLFHRLMRMRRDAIFFHAASIGVRGRGLLLVGPKGAGKSTLALALASRGHVFLGDEIAGFLPASGELIPFRRPAGIKPGPRSRGVDEALARLARNPERDGLLRIPISQLMPAGPEEPLPLSEVVFLRGFAARPELARVEPGREELSELQPVVGSLVNAAATLRVLQMARLLSAVRAYHLRPGQPDETAELLERAVGAA